MESLILNTFDNFGGAARAAYRLHLGLCALGASSQMLVRTKSSSDETVIDERSIVAKAGRISNYLPLLFYPKLEDQLFSTQWFPDMVHPKVAKINPDIINLHWICGGYLQVETLKKFKKPLVWTLQDMWAFTGGCHYSYDCDRYKENCGQCPQLRSSKSYDLSRWIWRRKLKAWRDIDLTIVTPCAWMAECVKESSLFRERRVEVIPFCLNTKVYKPIDQKIARELLNLPQDKKLILFGAIAATTDRRKGFPLLLNALNELSRQAGWRDKFEVVVFGSSKPKKMIDYGFHAHYLGSFADDVALALVYSSADVMVVPSLQESFGQTASEALACGTPVVAFDATGLKDIVDHQVSGYLAKPYESEDLAKGIAWVLEDQDRHQRLRIDAREKAEEKFALELQAQRYLELFHEILTRSGSL